MLSKGLDDRGTGCGCGQRPGEVLKFLRTLGGQRVPQPCPPGSGGHKEQPQSRSLTGVAGTRVRAGGLGGRPSREGPAHPPSAGLQAGAAPGLPWA